MLMTVFAALVTVVASSNGNGCFSTVLPVFHTRNVVHIITNRPSNKKFKNN